MFLSSYLEPIGYRNVGEFTLDWLMDQNDKTCNKESEPPVYLALNASIPLKWTRIVVSTPGIFISLCISYLQVGKIKIFFFF